jgi:hypothetical protein
MDALWPLGAARLLQVSATLFFVGCASRAAPLAAAPGSSPTGREPDATGEPRMQAGPSPTSGKPPSALFPAEPLPGGEAPTPEKSLPELRIEPFGMHVGGGKNTPEEKAPFHRALEQKFPAFMECYRLAEEPWSGGSFGVDLKIARGGGAPVVEQPRTRIRGTGFQDCMVAAFAKVSFEKPKAGPTVISYSVMFTLGKGKRQP